MDSLTVPWCTPADMPARVLSKLTEAADVTSAIQTASDVLYALSGRRWRGAGARAGMTLHAGCDCTPGGWGVRGVTWADAQRIGYDSRTLDTNEWGMAWAGLRLPDYPVLAVTSLTRNGTAVPLAKVSLEQRRDLMFLPYGGSSWWGRGDYVVSYTFGVAPPPSGRIAAGILAGEIALSALGMDCRLPMRVSAVTRQGVSAVVLDPLDFLNKGRTGLPEVDLFLSAVNPARLANRPMVMSPDFPYPVRQTHPQA